ncbi:MAG: NAD(P)-dependent alcohol dehydrogenase [Methanomassiliicoccales archaeon]|jgi:NADPH:quinone reductase-like Zn-dependent oxidoreductase
MRAAVWTKFGPPDVLELQEVERPAPGEDELLIKVHAASINSWDWELMKGEAQITFGGRLRPKYKILGCDVAGVVEDIGRNVKGFKLGDEVFGDISGSDWGGFAEYVCAKERVMALKSPKMSFEQAAATPQAAVLALQGLRDKGDIRQGQRVLINGAGGGVGTFAVQIAKSFGAEVTGVDFTDKLEMLRSIGADRVIDCSKEDFTRMDREYDLIVDVMSQRSIFDYKRALAPKGVCVLVGGSAGAIFPAMIFGSWVLWGKKVRVLLLRPNSEDLAHINDLFEIGKLIPIIDGCYALDDIAEAFRYYIEGRVKGKIVITVP